MKDFAKIVAERRKMLNMTQEELARHLDITPQAVSKWENSIGFPDVTLFPRLSEILRLSIDELFGMPKRDVEPPASQAIPQSYEGMPLTAEFRGTLCYSNKQVKEKDANRVLFIDGSVAELEAGRVINRGEGEIRLIHGTVFTGSPSMVDLGGECITRTTLLSHFSSVILSFAHKCEVKVLSDPSGEPRMIARGREGMLNRLESHVENNTLTVRMESLEKNFSSDSYLYHIEIFVPFKVGDRLKLTVNGEGEVSVEPDFAEGEVSINGCGNAAVASFDRFTGQISGSGDIAVGDVRQDGTLKIAGSGDIALAKVSNPDVRIAGSGDVSSARAEGKLKIQIAGSGDVTLGKVALDSAEIKISGSGDVTMHGEATSLKLVVSGSGSLEGGALTVGVADLAVKGSGEIKLARIVSESVERLSRDASLRVGRRG